MKNDKFFHDKSRKDLSRKTRHIAKVARVYDMSRKI